MSALVLFSIGSAVISSVLFGVLFGRSEGTSPLRYTYAELDADRYPRRVFSFSSAGNTLIGYRYDVPHPTGLIVVAGGLGAGADAHLPEVTWFADRGWSVITYDPTGVGASEGRGVMGLSQGKIDLQALLGVVRADPMLAQLPVVIYGHSAGGYAAAAVLAESDADSIAAVVCLNAFESPVDTMLYHARKRVGFLADIEVPFLLLQNRITFGDDANDSALAAINGSGTPVLVLEGQSDQTVPHEIGLLRFEEAFTNPNVQCVAVTDAYRGAHATPWLSRRAAAYVAAYTGESAPDKILANELDPRFMNEVLTFFAAAIEE